MATATSRGRRIGTCRFSSLNIVTGLINATSPRRNRHGGGGEEGHAGGGRPEELDTYWAHCGTSYLDGDKYCMEEIKQEGNGWMVYMIHKYYRQDVLI